MEGRPKLTNTMLLQPSQCVNRRPVRILPTDVNITIRVDIARRPPELNTRDDQPHQPEDKQDEGAQDDDSGQQRALRDQPEHQGEEQYRERADRDPVRDVPKEEVSSLARWASRGRG